MPASTGHTSRITRGRIDRPTHSKPAISSTSRPPAGTVIKTIVNPATEEVLAETYLPEAGGHQHQSSQGGDTNSNLRSSQILRARGRVPVPDRSPDPGAGPGAGRAGEPGQRQADPGEPRCGRAAGCGSLLLLRRVGRQGGACGCRGGAAAVGRCGTGDPVELPADDAGLEDRTGAGLRQHGGAVRRPEATPLTALLFAEICQQADLPPGVVNILTGAGATGRADGRGSVPGWTRSPSPAGPRGRGAGRSHRPSPAPARRQHSRSLGGKATTWSSTTPPSSGRRGHRQRHLLQPGPCVLRRVGGGGAVSRRRGRRPAARSA